MEANLIQEASAFNGEPQIGVHFVRNDKGDWVMILITTGERLNKTNSKIGNKSDGWYWAQEKTPSNFIGPFNSSVEAITNCAHILQGNDNFVFWRDSHTSVKRLPILNDLTVETGIHAIERRNGKIVKVAILHSDEAPENHLPDGYYWSADYAKNKATGPFTSANDAMLDAVRVIQDWKEGETAILDVEIRTSSRPTGVTLH